MLAHPYVQIAPPIRNRQDEDRALMCIAQELAKLEALWGAEQEIREAVEDLDGLADEGLTWRLKQASQAKIEAERGPEAARAEGVIAPNGVEMNKDELDHAQKMWASIDFTRGGKARH